MNINSKIYKSILFANPMIVEDEIVIRFANNLLLSDTGIEIESTNPKFNKNKYNNKYLIKNESTSNELRFRIPKGIDGFKCLYEISKSLNKYSLLSRSGIHIHVDLYETRFFENNDYKNFFNSMDIFKDVFSNEFIKFYLLNYLDKWNYSGKYNRREVSIRGFNSTWIRLQKGFKTIECRIIPMTFNYFKLTKYIVEFHLLIDKVLTLYYNIYNNKNNFTFEDALKAYSEEIILKEINKNKQIIKNFNLKNRINYV